MTTEQKTVPIWILVVTGLFAAMELLFAISVVASPESTLDNVDFAGKGAIYLSYMWAARQLALGFVLAFAVFRKSVPMLTICYIFLIVMFAGDLLTGLSLHMNSASIAGAVMALICSAILFVINRRK